MKNNNFTKGKWEIQEEKNKSGNRCFCVFSNVDVIATTEQSMLSGFEQEANAKLIAAAPELLQALQTAVEHIKNIQEKYKPEHPFAVGRYEAAIKKATTE